MMRAFTGPLHLFCAFVSRMNQGLHVGFGDLTRIGFVGPSTLVIMNNIGLIPMEILIQSGQLGALPFLRDIVPQQASFVRASSALPCHSFHLALSNEVSLSRFLSGMMRL